jgi:substrate-binding family protein
MPRKLSGPAINPRSPSCTSSRCQPPRAPPLAERVPDVDAVFVANDPMAIAALEALRSLGRRVPDDVAVIGFDDIAEPP